MLISLVCFEKQHQVYFSFNVHAEDSLNTTKYMHIQTSLRLSNKLCTRSSTNLYQVDLPRYSRLIFTFTLISNFEYLKKYVNKNQKSWPHSNFVGPALPIDIAAPNMINTSDTAIIDAALNSSNKRLHLTNISNL